MNKIKKTNMNIKKITIAMLITLISIGNYKRTRNEN